ncbi:MAG: response regulator [Candidatus Eremiobacteraeota bacterium]|nr:response regulator [Candidatus Eremiobacteraeota bacterium]
MSYWPNLIDRIPQGICILEEHLIVLAWNRCLEDWTGIPRSEIVGRSVCEFFPDLSSPRFRERLKMVFGHGCPAIFSPQLHGYFFDCDLPDGGKRLQKATVSALPREDGRFDAVVAVEDVTEATHRVRAYREVRDRALAEVEERKRTEERLRASEDELSQARDAAIRLAESRARFTANVSHELRTPMNGILGMLQLIERDHLPEDVAAKLDTITDCGVALLNVINEILDFAKLESGKFTLQPVDFNLAEEVQSVLDLLSGQARGKGVRLEGRLAAEVPVHLHGDAGRIRQVLINLVGNSLKFTEAGSVTVGAELLEHREDTARLRMWVADTGVGIPADKLGTIFDHYTQVERSDLLGQGGTGLGLAICKELMERMGGSLTIESEVGHGTTLSMDFELPLQKTPQLARPRLPEPDFPVRPELRVLLADDNMINRKVAVGLLRRLGCQVEVATDGQEAVDAFRRQDFDIVLMDVQMPVLDGFGATERLRLEERHTGRDYTPVIALTAHAADGWRERCLNAGMDDYLCKPIQFASLRECLSKKCPL